MRHRQGQSFIIVTLFFSILLTLLMKNTSAKALSGYERLYGNDRYETAIEISKSRWSSSNYVIIASGNDFPDALCAGPLAKIYDAPILLTDKDMLYSSVLEEIKRLNAVKAIIIGGTGAVSNNVEISLLNAGLAVERIYGIDRYATSVEIAEKIDNTGSIVLTTGEDFPDAISITAIASKLGIPILLTEHDNLPSSVMQYIKSHYINRVYIIGGPGAVGSNIENIVPNPVRLGGTDRYITNAMVMEYFKDVLDLNSIFLATGRDFPDALTGGVLASYESSPMLLVDSFIPIHAADYFEQYALLYSRITAMGGPAVVPQSVIDEMLRPTLGRNYENSDHNRPQVGGSDGGYVNLNDRGISTMFKTFNLANAAPGDKFSGTYSFKNTGARSVKLKVVFNYPPQYPDLGTQLVINSMTYNGDTVALPEDMSYGTVTFADLNGISLTLSDNLPSWMFHYDDFVITGEFYYDPVNSQNEYMNKELNNIFTFTVVEN